MATVYRRGDLQWQAKIRRKGYPPQSRTFEIKADAVAWARDIEREMDRGVFVSRTEAESTTLHEALERYLREVTPRKKGAEAEASRIRRWQSHSLAKSALARIRGKDLAKFRDDRRTAGRAENTIRLDLALISALYETARKDWGLESLLNPVKMIKAPGGSNKRERRLLPGEEKWLLSGIEATMSRTPTIRALLQLALETGMRQSEILSIDWNDVDLKRKFIHLPDTKSGDPRDVPLSPVALCVLQSMPRPINGGNVFPLTQDRLIRGFRAALKKGRELYEAETSEKPAVGFLENLRFHDLRHEAASRWASVLAAQELAKMFGWRTLQMALRYYHPTGESLAAKLATAQQKPQ
jgi:integrase